MKRLFFRKLLISVFLFVACFSYGQGIFYQLPADGYWATYDVQFTFRSGDVVESGKLITTISSAGSVMTDAGASRWIEFFKHTPDTSSVWIRKLLIPEKYLNPKSNPTKHAIRGWTQSAGETNIEVAVPFHGQWPAYLAGPLNDPYTLPEMIIETRKGAFESRGIGGWIRFTDDRNHITTVTIENRINKTVPFGVVSARMFFGVVAEEGNFTYNIDVVFNLIDFGTGATTRIPTHN